MNAGVNALQRIGDAIQQNIIDKMFSGQRGGGSGILGFLGNLLGGGGQWYSGPALQGAGLFHQGGIVGQSVVPNVYLHPALFANAPRLHRGLGADEFPAILQRGERVIPRGGAGSTTIVLNAPINIDASGAMPGTVPQIVAATQAGIKDLERRLPDLIRRHQQNRRVA